MEHDRKKAKNSTNVETIAIISLTAPNKPIKIANGHIRKHIRSNCFYSKISETDDGPKLPVIKFRDTGGLERDPVEFKSVISKSNGILLVVDLQNSGFQVPHETILKKAVRRCSKVILFVNGLDKLLLKKQTSLEIIQSHIQIAIDKSNDLFSTNPVNPETNSDLFQPTENGSVFFGSLSEDWTFTVQDFATEFSSIFKTSATKLNRRLWGNHFYNRETKKWRKTKEIPCCESGFSLFILRPLMEVIQFIINDEKKKLDELLELFNIELKKEDFTKEKKVVINTVMQSWFSS